MSYATQAVERRNATNRSFQTRNYDKRPTYPQQEIPKPLYTETKLYSSNLEPIYTKTAGGDVGLKVTLAILVLIIIGAGITIGVLYDQGYIRFGKNEKFVY